jgi:hypothetical protein
MSPGGALASILLVAAIPPWIHASSLVVLGSLGAGALMLLGTQRPSLAASLIGSLLATASYALALWSGTAPTGIVEPLVFGAALLLVLQHTDFLRRFDGAEVMPKIAGDAFRRWLVTVALAAAAVVVLTAAVGLVSDGAPPAFRPLLAGIGAFLALGAVIAVSGRAR